MTERCTHRGGTETAEGFIAHTRMVLDACVVDAPVRVWPRLRAKSSYGEELPIPERTDDGRLVYALPGGGWVAQ